MKLLTSNGVLRDTPAILLMLAAILGLTSLRLFGLFFLLLAIALVIPIKIGGVSRLVVSYLLFTSVLCIAAALAWLADVGLTAGWVISGGAVLMLATLMYAANRNWLSPRAKKFFEIDDVIALVMAGIAGAVLLMPLAPKPNAAKLAYLSIAGGDNSAHIEMIKGTDLNRGFAIGENNTYPLASNYYAYPQGWHLNGGFYKWNVERLVPIGSSPVRILLIFYSFSVLYFMLMVFLIARLSLWLLQKQQERSKNAPSPWARVATVGVVAVGVVGWTYQLISSGFQPQIASLVLILTEILLLIAAYDRPANKRYGLLLLAGLAAAGTSFMWVFLAPIAILGVAICALQTLISNKRAPIPFIGATVLLAAASLFQVIVQLKHPESGGGIDARGFVPLLSLFPLVGIFLGVAYWAYQKITSSAYRIMMVFSLIAMIFTVALMVYHLQTIGEVRYYYFKSLYTLVIFAIIFLGAIAGELAASWLQQKPPVAKFARFQPAMFVSFVLVAATMLGVSLKAPIFDAYTYRRIQGISPDQANVLMGLLGENPVNGIRYVPIGACDRGEDVRAVLLAQALTYTPDFYREPRVVAELTSRDTGLVFWQLGLYLNRYSRPLYVSSRDQSLNAQLMDYLQKNAADKVSLVKIIDIDPDPPATASAACPDRLGRPAP